MKPAEDFYRLRREGIGFIEQIGSRFWTDYNTHDPGITILEALCYAITDLAYRAGWDIKDLLAPESASAAQTDAYPDQPFFPAGDILTVNPATPDDFRRLLIDLGLVQNAWLSCGDTGCGPDYFAWCENGRLRLAFQPDPGSATEAITVAPHGLYDVLLELEVDPDLGDLNTRKIDYSCSFVENGDTLHTLKLELRFPEWGGGDQHDREIFLGHGDSLKFTVTRLGAGKTYNALDQENVDIDEYLRQNWRKVLYVDLTATLPSGLKSPEESELIIKNVAMRIYGDAFVKGSLSCEELISILENRKIPQCRGPKAEFTRRYHAKERKRLAAVESAKAALNAHRPLGEDFCRIKVVGVEEVAVCADIEVRPDADIELVQARIWFAIDNYFSPAVPFYTLPELLADGEAVEDIFNGPLLTNGFIKAGDLAKADLKRVLRVSDLVNILMDIDGVIAVNQVQLTKYDAEGNIISGFADPGWDSDGTPSFDKKRCTASWLMYVGSLHQPRFYLNGSRFLFFKNGLPFVPRMDEARDTLIQLRGVADRPKRNDSAGALPIPVGDYRSPGEYYPVQYSFPLTYGIGPEGLPANATDERKALARQLQAYLTVFDQLLGNAFAQLAHVNDLFSLNPDIKQTYFFQEFNKAVIQSYDDFVKTDLTAHELAAMTESTQEFAERRNRFLDHLMARFGEQFSEYALLLTNLQGRQVALNQLINDKISFLKAYPRISRDRGKAFDRTLPDSQANQAGIKKRINLLLGFPDLFFIWKIEATAGGTIQNETFQLQDRDGNIRLEGATVKGHKSVLKTFIKDVAAGKNAVKCLLEYSYDYFRIRLLDKDAAILDEFALPVGANPAAKALGEGFDTAVRKLLLHLSRHEDYSITASQDGRFSLTLKDQAGTFLGQSPLPFGSHPDAAAYRDDLVAWSAAERMIVVEHLLLRPKFPGDALYPACSDGSCVPCGEEDPYSFRLTFVMPGWTAPFDTNMAMRDFAERTIRQETPSHLLAKICWIDSLDFKLFEDAWWHWLEADAGIDWTEERLPERLAAILDNNLLAAGDTPAVQSNDLCRCAEVILTGFGQSFQVWLDARIASKATLKALHKFPSFPDPVVPNCAAFKPGTADLLKGLLVERYKSYLDVCYRLRELVALLGTLHNTYPPATLHDWDEGNDINPVRLGKTALGAERGTE
ncbi:MAG TPA: hypothetical protein VI298_02725 [Geobacteraceae bacterium]